MSPYTTDEILHEFERSLSAIWLFSEKALLKLKSGLFPKEQTEKEKALLKNKTILSGLAPNFKQGKAVFERNTLKIVEMDVLSENKHNIMRYW